MPGSIVKKMHKIILVLRVFTLIILVGRFKLRKQQLNGNK